MASIASLLNPVPTDINTYRQLPSPCSTTYARDSSSPPPPPKKQKMSKDAAIFTKGKIRGELRYPPCEYQNRELAAAHKAFQIHPMGHIAEYPRHIPYNSEKKSFLERTGRESFEVFQYTFKVPDDDRTYTTMWDYNVGLVRTTPLFKCNRYSKTTPAKMLGLNPGLRDICHSITGGALAAQGYWMPFEAAKAIAATFCFKIRHALTPIFGVDFLALCIPPHDPRFGRMIIEDASVVRRCSELAREYRALEARVPRASSVLRSPETSEELKSCRWNAKYLRPKPIKVPDTESGYGTDVDQSGRYYISPGTPYGNEWTPTNTPRSAPLGYPLPSPREVLASTSPCEAMEEINRAGDSSSSGLSTPTKRNLSDLDEDYDSESSSGLSSDEVERVRRRKRLSTPMTSEARAAYMLMRLHVHDSGLREDGYRRKRRRASA